VLRVLGSLDNCRPAEAGEFTRRAFLNGRMDLSQVEGLADIIDAETEAQRRQAVLQLEGRLGNVSERWRERILGVLALLEASLDFSDEGDVPEDLEADILREIGSLRAEIGQALANRSGERLREGLTVVLAGPPNAGKSTLLNALAQRDVAIVSPIAGTTRDVIEVHCDLGGLPVIIVDTAGLRESGDLIEQEGVSRHDCDLTISASTGEGLPDLIGRLEQEAGALMGQGDAIVTRERHRRALERAEDALERAQSMLACRGPLELAAEEVRLGSRAIGQITGRVDVEDVLDRLFSSFCIGK
jgi:tRNA modification GTPase